MVSSVHVHGQLIPRARSAQFTWIVVRVYVPGQLKAHVHSMLEFHVNSQLSSRAWSLESACLVNGVRVLDQLSPCALGGFNV
jgi:hypothetical protein